MHSELQSHIASYQRSSHERKVLQERITQKLDHQETQLRVHFANWRANDDVCDTKIPRNLRKSEASCYQYTKFDDYSS